MRPHYLDRIGVDDRFLLVVSLLLGLAIGCELPPSPGPIPQPPPIVVADATLIVLEETADRTPEIAAVLGDITFWSGLGTKWRFIDDDSPEAAAYLSLVNDRPGLIVFDKAGKRVWGGPLPRSTDEIRKLVK